MTDLVALSLAGRCANGAERGKGVLYHAVPNTAVYFLDRRRALCGAKPGRSSVGWSSSPGIAVTCPRCRAAIAKAAAQPQQGT